MRQTLFLKKDEGALGRTGFAATFFGLRAEGKGTYDEYYALRRRITCKDLEWTEVKNLQKVFAGARIWNDFPAHGLRFICAEFKGGDHDQRIDLLYLRDDGGLYPCELKIGGSSLDTHGQLIRYIADLNYQKIDVAWLKSRHRKYLKDTGTTDDREFDIADHELDTYISEREIPASRLRVIKNAGIIVDEDFKPQLLQAVRYLNEYCSFSIRLLKMETFVAEKWEKEQLQYLARIELTEIQ